MPKLSDYVVDALKRGYDKKELIELLTKKGYSRKEIDSALEELEPKSNVEIKESEIGYMQKVGLIFSNPNRFFSEIREHGIKDSLLLFLFTGLVMVVISYAFLPIGFFGGSSIFNIFGGLGLFEFGYASLFLGIIFKIIALFIYSGIVHGIIKMMGASGIYNDTFNACAYSLIPLLIISVIPLIGLLSIIYSIVLMAIGLSIYHNVSKTKAAFSAIIPIGVLIGIIFYMFLRLLY